MLIKLTDNLNGAPVLVNADSIVSVQVSRAGVTVVSVGTAYDLWVKESPDTVYDLHREAEYGQSEK